MGLVDSGSPRWRLVGKGDGHSLSVCTGRRVGPFTTRVMLGPRSRYGATYFKLLLDGKPLPDEGAMVMVGLHNTGQYPAQNWIEVARYDGIDDVADLIGVPVEEMEAQLWKPLASIVPPGGHMMIEYECDRWSTSRRALSVGIPPMLTPLGMLMLSIGVGHSYKDWYVAEGGLEGARKLQGFRALSSDHAARGITSMRLEIAEFLQAPRRAGCADLEATAISIAPRALALLKSRARRKCRTTIRPALDVPGRQAA